MELPTKKQETRNASPADTIPIRVTRTRPVQKVQPDRASKEGIIVVIVVVALLVAGAIGAAIFGNSRSETESQTGSFLKSETPEPYTSSEHGFRINFPGFPETEKTNTDVEGVSVPFTQYSKEIENGNKVYMVQIVNYPLSDFDMSGQERGALDGGINGMARSDGFKLITSSNNGTFLGYPSAEATYSLEVEGTSSEAFTTHFIKGNTLYSIMTVGEDKAAFDAFVQSFTFL